MNRQMPIFGLSHLVRAGRPAGAIGAARNERPAFVRFPRARFVAILAIQDRSVEAEMDDRGATIGRQMFHHHGAALDELMMHVGRVLYHWSLLDQALVADIRRLRNEGGDQNTVSRVRGSFGERLAEWRALLSVKSRRNPKLIEAILDVTNRMERLRQKRTLLTDRFADVIMDEAGGSPAVRVGASERETSAGQVTITSSELCQWVEEMDDCRRRLDDVENRYR
jgi:hypothetical protein